MKRALLPLALGALALACTSTPPVSQTFNFSRPADVELVCLDVQLTSDGHIPASPSSVRPQPLGECQTDAAGLPLSPIQQNTDGTVHGVRLFALVPQTDRGELAVVNLHPQYDTGIVDNFRLIPGYTFIPVGAVPSAVAVDPRGTISYVASSSEATITAIDNTTLLGAGPFRVGRAAAGAGQFVRHTLPAPAWDVRVVHRGAQFFLYATIPSRGSVLVKDVTDPTVETAFTEVFLASGSAPGSMDGGTMPGDGGAGLDGGTMPGDGGVVAAQPLQMSVDEQGTVYIADRGVSFVHVLVQQGNTLVETSALDSGVPTALLAASPPVPGAAGGATRFVYAISAVDQSLMVLDATTGRRVNTNVVLDPARHCDAPFTDTTNCVRIDPTEPRFDRVPLVAGATSVTFVSRGYLSRADCATPIADTGCSTLATDSPAGASVLRGLFAFVTLRSGQSQVIDIVDLDRACRTSETLPPAQAHIPRTQTLFTMAASVINPPALIVNSANVSVSGDQPHLITPAGDSNCDINNDYCVTLPSNLNGVRDDTWTITYEGTLPSLTTSGAQLSAPADRADRVRLLAASAHFCEFGALGGDRVTFPAVGPSVIEQNADSGLRCVPGGGDPNCPPSDTCLGIFGPSTAVCNREWQVVAATNSELTLAVPDVDTRCTNMALLTSAGGLRQALLTCYPESVRFDVHAGNSWLVTGAHTNFQHDVVVGPDGQCARSVPPDMRPRGRFATDQVIDTPWFSTRVAPGLDAMGHPVAPATGTAFTFSIVGGGLPLVLSTGSLPVSSRYSCAIERVYVVDQGRNRLIEVPVNPLDTATLSRTFN